MYWLAPSLLLSLTLGFTTDLPRACRFKAAGPTAVAARGQLTPVGRLRVVINKGNDVLTQQNGTVIRGLSVDLAKVLANALEVPLQGFVVASAGEAYQAVAEGRADLGFFGISDQRAKGSPESGARQGVAFTDPYIQIFGSYVVRKNSHFITNDQVDEPGVRIVVGKRSVYNLYLNQHIKSATIIQAPTSPDVATYMLNHEYEVGAGIHNQMVTFASQHPQLRVLPGAFMQIHQAMATSHQSADGLQFLNSSIRHMLANGCLSELAKKHRLTNYSLPSVSIPQSSNSHFLAN